jgi:hypothetical protein
LKTDRLVTVVAVVVLLVLVLPAGAGIQKGALGFTGSLDFENPVG